MPNLGGSPYRFFIVGTLGFIVDSSVFTVLLAWLQEPYFSRLGAFLVAVMATFVLNKRFTFAHRTRSRPHIYILSQTLSIAMNMAIFSLVIWHPIWLPGQYYLGLALGSVTAMFFNYEMSRRYVFL